MDDLKRIRLKIKDDKRYKNVRKIFNTNSLFQLPLDEYQDEVRNLFKMRKVRSLTLDASPKSLNKLAESIVQDQSYRSRMTEVLATVKNAAKHLGDMLDRFQDYATVTYARDLKAVGAAKERERTVKNVMAEYYRYQDGLTLLIEEIELYIKDIDKAGFAFKSMVDTLHIINQREFNLPNSPRK